MYTVTSALDYSYDGEHGYYVKNAHGWNIFAGNERDCQVFAYMMNKAEKEMCFIDGMLMVNERAKHNSEVEGFWCKVRKQIDNDAKLMEKEEEALDRAGKQAAASQTLGWNQLASFVVNKGFGVSKPAEDKEDKGVVHLSKGDILGPTYCGIPFDFVPHSSTMVQADMTCQKCLESLPSYYKSVVVKKDEKEDKSCNEKKVNFREFI